MKIYVILKERIFDRVNYDCKKYIKYLNKFKLTNNKIKKYYIFKIIRLQIKYNCFIPVTAQIGTNISFPHGLNGIFISSNAKIGNNCIIFQHVTIGSNNLEDSKNIGSPIIGKNVYIGAGAKIIGNVKVGDNVRIGANCIVTNDIPNNATVVMQMPKIIEHKKTRNNTFKTI